jgi:maltooligosyltrehalose trehalohydrolase
MDSHLLKRKLPVGAETFPDGTHFRVWAPRRERVSVVLETGPGAPAVVKLGPEKGGYFSGFLEQARAGSHYRYELDDAGRLPDPASRFQPQGPHGPSEVIDPAAFCWTDQNWKGTPRTGQVIYEIHIGTFTREGTWLSAVEQLDELAGAGITVVELMPVAEFPGRFGWGYDGVGLFAPTRLYGNPGDLRRFVDRAHQAGIGVILDVVYNHFGPDGNYMKEFSEDYFTGRYENEWGEAVNFDGDNSGPVREFFVSNAGYWIDEYHLDGLRLDATQQVFDSSPEHILKAVADRVRQAARGRHTLIVAENEEQQTNLVRCFGIDALWNDDFHHSAVAALTGRNEAYYTDYHGKPQEFISAIKYGYLYQGQLYKWQGKRRGTPSLDLPPEAFVTYIENHDQVANSAGGLRLNRLTSPGKLRAMTALMLLAPPTPMLFQGQEFASSAPFLFFADHEPDLARLVSAGRATFLSQFRSIATAEMQKCLPDPCDPASFAACKLNFSERELHAGVYALHRDLLHLRHNDPVFSRLRPRGVDGAVLGAEAFALRFFGEGGDDRLLLVNLGLDLHLNPAPEPLLAPVAGKRWEVLWSSEYPRYGGVGTYPPDSEENWRIPGNAAIAMYPASAETP